MSSQTLNSQNNEEGLILKPNPRLPLIIIAFGFCSLILPIIFWPSIIIIIFGVFLLLQSFTLKLKFTSQDLIVIQLGREIRRFPFSKWISWRLFLPWLPGLLYFREEASPHLLPIIFDCKTLQSELGKKVGNLEITRD